MKTKHIITALLLLSAVFSPLAAQDKKHEKIRKFDSSNFYDNTFYKVMGGSSYHKVIPAISDFYTYTPAINISVQGGKEFSPASSLYLFTGIQDYYRTSGLRPRILFGEADVMYSLDVTNLIFGYNPRRVFDFALTAGAGIDVLRTFGEWSLGTNARAGATFRVNFNEKFALVIDPYCKYMKGQLADVGVYDTKVFEHGALIGFQYTVYDKDRRAFKKSIATAHEYWDPTLERPTGSHADDSYFTLTGGSAFRIGTKKLYNLSYDLGFTVGRHLDKLNSLNLGLLYEGYEKRPHKNETITNPKVNQAEFNVTHNINLTNAFYGFNPDNVVTFYSVEGLGFDVLSDTKIHFGMNVHAGVEMDVRMSEHFAFLVSPMFNMWMGDVNFREEASFDIAPGFYVNAGLKYNLSNSKNKDKHFMKGNAEEEEKGFDATRYALQKRYNPNEVVKAREFAFDAWTIQLTGGFNLYNPDLGEFRPDGHGFLGVERRLGNFQWLQLGYGMGIATRKADGYQLMMNEIDFNYRFSITNLLNGYDLGNSKAVNVSAMAGTGLDFSYLEYDGTNIGTHLLLGFDFGFKVSDRARIVLDPYFKLMTDGTDHSQSWKGYDACYGASLGLRVDLDSRK